VNETELLELLEMVVEADQQGVVITETNVTSSHWLHDWDLSHSIYFIAVTLTTIGSSLGQSVNRAIGRVRALAYVSRSALYAFAVYKAISLRTWVLS